MGSKIAHFGGLFWSPWGGTVFQRMLIPFPASKPSQNRTPGNKSNKFTTFNSKVINEQITNIKNKDELINFIMDKKPFDNLSEFQYYPFKLFHEVLNE